MGRLRLHGQPEPAHRRLDGLLGARTNENVKVTPNVQNRLDETDRDALDRRGAPLAAPGRAVTLVARARF